MKFSRRSEENSEKTKILRFSVFSAVLGLCSSERAQKMLQNELLDVKKLVDTAENGPSQWPKSCAILVRVDVYGVGPARRNSVFFMKNAASTGCG